MSGNKKPFAEKVPVYGDYKQVGPKGYLTTIFLVNVIAFLKYLSTLTNPIS